MGAAMINLSADMIEQAAQVAPDQTLATSFLAPEARAGMITLILFTHELARARQAVSEPMLAAIRLQWWREALDEIYTGKTVRAQPTALALAETIRAFDLPRPWFDDMIDAFGVEQDAVPFETWASLAEHADQTYGNFNRLALLIAGAPAISSPLDDVARHGGILWRLCDLMAQWPRWTHRRQLWLPLEAQAGLDVEATFEGKTSPVLAQALQQAHGHVLVAHKAANQACRKAAFGQAFPAVAYASLGLPCAKAFQALRDPFREVASLSLFERQLRLVWAVARQRI
jgi:phytoene/squalene synthetase